LFAAISHLFLFTDCGFMSH